MLPRTLEPEVMDTAEEADDYDAMDHGEVNRLFVDAFLAALPDGSPDRLHVLDTGTGTALIPIELCGRDDRFHVTAIDLAKHMLERAEKNVGDAELQDAITLELVDSKRLPYDDESFDAVMSNSIVHHVPEPSSVLSEMLRVTRPGGLFFVRDLMRPDDDETVESLVATYAADANERQRQLLRQSLHAALTLDEIRDLVAPLGLPGEACQATSDRHWTIAATKPSN